MDENIIIYADNHEASSKIITILENRCKVEQKKLEVGDYLLSKRVCVERKTTQDFLSSLIDGRLFTQIQQMLDNFKNPVIIIEGETLFYEDRKIHPNAIRGALAAITIDLNVPILWTRNQLETAEMLFSIAKREQTDKKKNNAVRGRKKLRSANEMQEYIISGLPKISREKAKALLKHFNTPERIFTANEEELKNVEGIGSILAKRIRRILTKKYEKSILED
ncbi:MAG: helix-hairpin-helix domain-containing protein [Candidatus Aenigmarchaeota archaeon]|nr:helix-hairpin-helix domain-containing protein [Candidatus Aenigmarchaeota archaeon]